MEWQAPAVNFYALAAAVLNPKFTVSQSLVYFNVLQQNDIFKQCKQKKKRVFDYIPNKQNLESLYTNKKMTQKEIGNIYGVTQATVSLWLKEYEIKTRCREESYKLYKERERCK